MANLQVASVGDTFLDTFKRSRQSSQIFMPKTRQDSHGWNENQCKARKFVGHNCNYQSFFRDAIECKVKVKNDIMFFSDRKQIYRCQPRINNFWLLICWVTPIRHKLLVKCLPLLNIWGFINLESTSATVHSFDPGLAWQLERSSKRFQVKETKNKGTVSTKRCKNKMPFGPRILQKKQEREPIICSTKKMNLFKPPCLAKEI